MQHDSAASPTEFTTIRATFGCAREEGRTAGRNDLKLIGMTPPRPRNTTQGSRMVRLGIPQRKIGGTELKHNYGDSTFRGGWVALPAQNEKPPHNICWSLRGIVQPWRG